MEEVKYACRIISTRFYYSIIYSIYIVLIIISTIFYDGYDYQNISNPDIMFFSPKQATPPGSDPNGETSAPHPPHWDPQQYPKE